ncbi:hypothetical protein [Martelella alba]|uniref:Uncharacterized protein n=1 Tax=Martelella alba TaxID=2590451 RepID=A0ABY2SH31_9HYPH|nr:hypothetical protein [Martelella alba]TKI04575.1 hypothetical protein FCN80_17310 [Martelella alba]
MKGRKRVNQSGLACSPLPAPLPASVPRLITRLAYIAGVEQEKAMEILGRPYADGGISSDQAAAIRKYFPFLNLTAGETGMESLTIALVATYLQIEYAYEKGHYLPHKVLQYIASLNVM